MLKNALTIAEKAAYLMHTHSSKGVKKNRIVEFIYDLKVMGRDIEEKYERN